MTGPNIMVSGAVFADELIVENLTDYISVVPRQNAKDRSPLDDAVYRVARLFRAIKGALNELDDYYVKVVAGIRSVPTAPGRARAGSHYIGPHFTSYRDRTSKQSFTLTYTQRLVPHYSDKALFVAEAKEAPDSPAELVVVKFAYKYNEAAHAALAASSLAPKLRYCSFEPSMGLYVVVMDYVEGGELWDRRKASPARVDSLRSAVKMLHENGLVFGDLRRPNVLVVGDRVVLVDFDWCGKAGEARYPSDIAPNNGEWHPDVRRGGLITREHDNFHFHLLTGTQL